MKKEKKLVHLSVLEGTTQEIGDLRDALKDMKEAGKLPEHYEFLITNDRIELKSAKHLIEYLYNLIKQDRELKEVKKNE